MRYFKSNINIPIMVAAFGILSITQNTNAGLSGASFNMSTEYTDSPFLPGGSFTDYGSFTVGNGTEWIGPLENVYHYETMDIIIGSLQFSLDIGDDYIELTTTWTNTVADNAWTFLTLMPGDFYGYHLSFDAPTNIASASLDVSGNPVNMGDLNLYELSDPGFENWVDSFIMDPNSPDRITMTENGLDLNMQGIAWEYTNIIGQTYSETARIDFTFVPAPSALTFLGIAGFCRRRRI